jgi:hypothetical protein
VINACAIFFRDFYRVTVADVTSRAVQFSHRSKLRTLYLLSQWVGKGGSPKLVYDAPPTQDELHYLEENDIAK